MRDDTRHGLVLLFIAILICGSMIVSCKPIAKHPEIANNVSITTTGVGGYELYTMKHDGHLWICGYGLRNFIHHPDCPCLESAQTNQSK